MSINETKIEEWRRKLIFRSDHRGIKEMDIIMGRFARENVPAMNEAQLSAYEALLKENDPDLYNWITGKEIAPDRVSQDLLQGLQKACL